MVQKNLDFSFLVTKLVEAHPMSRILFRHGLLLGRVSSIRDVAIRSMDIRHVDIRQMDTRHMGIRHMDIRRMDW